MPFGSIVRSIANIRRWRGGTPKELVGGRVPAHLGAASALFGIKSIQRGYFSTTIATGSTATIALATAVIPAKTVVITTSSTGFSLSYLTFIVTAAQVITITNHRSSEANNMSVEWQAVEFY